MLVVPASHPQHQQAEDPAQATGLEGGNSVLVHGPDKGPGFLGHVPHIHVFRKVIQAPRVARGTVQDEQCFVREAIMGTVPLYGWPEVHKPLLEEAHGHPDSLV